MGSFLDKAGLEYLWNKIKQWIPTKTSDIENDSGYITDYTETDPTVPGWAKQPTKPAYSAGEVGAAEADHTHTAAEVGALPDTTVIPSKTSELTNDSNYVSDANYVHTDSNYTAAEKTKLAGIAEGANKYTHPSYTAAIAAAVKVGRDATGHVVTGAALTASDIGAAASSHTHDSRYYTESEMDTKLAGKSDTGHTHDDRYYTESEMDTKLATKYPSTNVTTSTADLDLNNYKTTGIYHCAASMTNAPLTNHGTVVVDWNVGTKYQLYFPDNQNTAYKRTWNGTDSVWNAWTQWKFTDTTALGSMTGTLGVDHGGTGKTTAKDAGNALIDALDTATANWTDDTLIVTSDATGDTDLYYKRAAIKAWNYIKGKADSVYLKLTGGTLTGRLTTAKPINQIVTGSGTAASDKGSGVSPRYFPAKWTFNTGQTATNGDIITIKLPVAGHDYGVFMSIDNGSHYYPVVLGNGTGRLTTHYPNATPITLIFDSSGSAASMYALNGADARATVTGGVWRVVNFYDANTVPQAYCSTAAATAGKYASMSGYVATAKSYIMVSMTQANSVAGAITLNINGTGAKPIYINGSASSASNHTLPAGSYLVYYNGTNYYFRTDGKITGDITGTAGYSTMSSSEIKTGTATTQRVMTAANIKAGIRDLFYPVGSYYETSDASFNPNTAWGGTWVLETEGQVHIGAGTDYTIAGALTNTSDGGSKDVNTNVADATKIQGAVRTSGTMQTQKASKSTSGTLFIAASTSDFSRAGSSTHVNQSNMQPYIVVNRWHRTA